MRRKEKEITDREAIDKIIHSAQVCRLGLTDGKLARIVPMCFGYDGNNLYFHSATDGEKIEMLKNSPVVSFEIDTDVSMVTNTSACNWSMRYKSVFGTGSVKFITEDQEKQHALDLIMSHYEGPLGPYGPQMLKKVCTFSISIEQITAKQS